MNRDNIVGISVTENLTQKQGFSDPRYYYRSSVKNRPVTLLIDFEKPLALDRIDVYPMLPAMDGASILEDIRSNYTLEVFKYHNTSAGYREEWEVLESRGGYNNRVEVRWDRDDSCRDFPRSCKKNEHVVQRKVPYVLQALCSLKNKYGTCTNSTPSACYCC